MFSCNALLWVLPEITGAASGACSQTPSGGGSCPPLESEISAVVCPTLPVDHSRSTPAYLAHVEGAAQALPSCRALGRDSDQACGFFRHLAVATAGCVCSQGSESNNGWYSVAVSSFWPTSVVTATDF